MTTGQTAITICSRSSSPMAARSFRRRRLCIICNITVIGTSKHTPSEAEMNAQRVLEEMRSGAVVISRLRSRSMGGKAHREWLLKRKNGTIVKIQASTFAPIRQRTDIEGSVWSGDKYVYEYRRRSRHMNLNLALEKIGQQLGVNTNDMIAYAQEDSIGGFDLGKGTWPMGSVWGDEGKYLYAIIRAMRPARVLEL